MSSGGLTTNNSEYVGDSGIGGFTLSAGTNTVSKSLYIGYSAAASGAYSLTGLLTSGTESVGYSGTGSFIQSGGTNSIATLLSIGYNVASSGAYTLTQGQRILSCFPRKDLHQEVNAPAG